MGDHHHIHTQSDPKSLEEAKTLYSSFMTASKNITIAICAVLVLMAVVLL